MPPSSNCRLCGGETAPAFDGVVLGRHRVQYLRCLTCASLETETPHWLHDAYADGEATANLAEADTGAAQRNLQTWAGTMVVAGLLGLRNIVDFGGGDGLLVRLLRDHGLNAFVSDEYAAATYARGFTRPDFARPDLVTAFEVIEHFADPAANLAQIFGGQPRAVLLSTLVYDGQGAEWWYLAPHGGQHVFFYSERGLQLIAERYGYVLVRAGFLRAVRATGDDGRESAGGEISAAGPCAATGPRGAGVPEAYGCRRRFRRAAGRATTFRAGRTDGQPQSPQDADRVGQVDAEDHQGDEDGRRGEAAPVAGRCRGRAPLFGAHGGGARVARQPCHHRPRIAAPAGGDWQGRYVPCCWW